MPACPGSRDALARADRAISLSAQNAGAHLVRGEALWALGDRGLAIGALQESADLHDAADLRVRMVGMRCSLGDHEGERADLDRAVAMDLRNAATRYLRARALVHVAADDRGRLGELCEPAIADLERILGEDPSHEEAAGLLGRARGMLADGAAR